MALYRSESGAALDLMITSLEARFVAHDATDISRLPLLVCLHSLVLVVFSHGVLYDMIV